MINTQSLKYVPILILISACVNILHIDMFAPGMPLMAKSFSVTSDDIQQIIVAFWISVICSALFWGPISDSFGRRKIVLIGSFLMVIGGFVCSFAPSLEILTIGRYIQGIGDGAIQALTFAMIKDLYKGRESAKYIARVSIAIILSIPAGYQISGLLIPHFGWRSAFYFLNCVAIVSFALNYFFLQDTHPESLRSKISTANIVNGYKQVFSNRLGLMFMAIQPLLYGGIWCYRTVSPFVFINQFGVQVENFYVYALILSGAQLTGALFINRYVESKGTSILLMAGAFSALFGACLFMTTYFLGLHNQYTVILSMIPFCMGTTMTLSTSLSKVMLQYTALGGAIASSVGVFRNAFITLGTYSGKQFNDADFHDVSIYLLISSLLAVLICLLSVKKLRKMS